MTNLKYKMLRKIHNTPETNPIRETSLLKKHHVIECTNAIKELLDSGLMRKPVGSDTLRITQKGIEALETEQTRREDAIRADIRYWITTAIAIAALVVSILS